MASAGTQEQVLDFEVMVYVHRLPITVDPSGGIEAYPVQVTIARSSRKGAAWHLDCVDIEAFEHVLPKRSNGRGQFMANLQQAIMAAVADRGIPPSEVMGWFKWFHTHGQELNRWEAA